MIIPKTEWRWLEEWLIEEGHVFDPISVVSATDIAPERLAELRAQYGKPASREYGDLEWKKQRIEELKRQHDRS